MARFHLFQQVVNGRGVVAADAAFSCQGKEFDVDAKKGRRRTTLASLSLSLSPCLFFFSLSPFSRIAVQKSNFMTLL